jgi:hypothetical protein
VEVVDVCKKASVPLASANHVLHGVSLTMADELLGGTVRADRVGKGGI